MKDVVVLWCCVFWKMLGVLSIVEVVERAAVWHLMCSGLGMDRCGESATQVAGRSCRNKAAEQLSWGEVMEAVTRSVELLEGNTLDCPTDSRRLWYEPLCLRDIDSFAPEMAFPVKNLGVLALAWKYVGVGEDYCDEFVIPGVGGAECSNCRSGNLFVCRAC
jgi:hypothetical protein